jgi:hypothetical protein
VTDFFDEARAYQTVVAGRGVDALYVEGQLMGNFGGSMRRCVTNGRAFENPAQQVYRFSSRDGGTWVFSTVMGPIPDCRIAACPEGLRCEVAARESRCGPGFNSLIEVRTACSFPSTNVVCNDSVDGQAQGSTVEIPARRGQVYYIVVSSHSVQPNPENSHFILSAAMIGE